jgi:hypothetical protein
MAGFLLAVAGAVAVARFGKTEQATAGAPLPEELTASG